jgi:hypothetical protein
MASKALTCAASFSVSFSILSGLFLLHFCTVLKKGVPTKVAKGPAKVAKSCRRIGLPIRQHRRLLVGEKMLKPDKAMLCLSLQICEIESAVLDRTSIRGFMGQGEFEAFDLLEGTVCGVGLTLGGGRVMVGLIHPPPPGERPATPSGCTCLGSGVLLRLQ